MPRIQILVKPNAKQTVVEKMDAGSYRISVKAAPDQGKANRAVIEALHEYFGLPKACFRLVRGSKTKQKTVEIDADIEV